MKILIVDDDPFFLELVEASLLRWGYTVVWASDGNEAWNILQQKDSPRLVLLDWVMPSLDGVELCKKLRKRENAPYLYIILLTSKKEKEDVVKGLEAGGDDFVTKPFEPMELKTRLEVGARILEYVTGLARLNNELDDKNKEIQQVINVVSHDLRSPLINIQGFTKELIERLKDVALIINNGEVSPAAKKKLLPLLESDIAEECDYICACSSKMDTLVSGLSKVICLDRVRLVIMQLDMNKLIRTIVKTLDYNIKHSGTKVEIDQLPSCRGDAVRIDQVFSNLLDNALKYLSPNRPGIIKISGQREGGDIVYCVEDNGLGIPANHLEKVFEIFHRINPNNAAGEGLGLSILKKILIRHGGKAWVKSDMDKGSRFFVSLPSTCKT